MNSIKTIIYFISALFLLISVLFAVFDRDLYKSFGEDYFILFIPYWLMFGCGIIVTGWIMQIYQEKSLRRRIRLLEKDKNELKVKLFDLINREQYAEQESTPAKFSKKKGNDKPISEPEQEKQDKRSKPDDENKKPGEEY